MSEIKYKLLGKELTFSDEMDLFNSLRKKYLMLAVNAKKKTEEVYDTNITGYSSYVNSCKRLIDEVFDEYLKMGVLDIIRYGIYDIDEVVLREEFVEECGSEYGNVIDEFVGEINRIDMEQMAADQERKEMIRNAGPIESSYVSVSGNIAQDMGAMVSNQVETAAINAVFAGGTALVTGAFRAVEKKAAEKERNTLFSRNSTKTDLLEGMEQDVYMLHHTIARLINERTGVEHFYYAKIEDMERFEPVCRNILRGNFKSEETPDLETEQIHRVLMMNPYELRMFCYIMKENGGITEELKTLMDYLCVDKASLADSYLETKFNIDDYNTYEAMVDFEKVVLEELVQFGVAECNFTCAVASKKEKLYIERRTFNQHTYETIEDRDAAEKQYYEFIGEGFSEFVLDELLEKYEETYDEALYEKNREDFRRIIVALIVGKVEEFTDTVSMESYREYCKTKIAEHNLEKWDVNDVFEKKYKKLERKEKFDAGVAAAKDKIAGAASNVMGHGKELIGKLPFGKKEAKEEQSAIDVTPTENSAAPAEHAEEKKKFSFKGFVSKKTSESPATESPASAQVPTVAASAETKNCPQCNNMVKATGKFCNKCGYRF